MAMANQTLELLDALLLDMPYSAFNISNHTGNITTDSIEEVRIEIFFAVIALATFGLIANGTLLLYILVKKLFHNYVSSHFIAHLAFTSLIACAYLLPTFIANVHVGGASGIYPDSIVNNTWPCRSHAFFTTCIWSVLHYMTTCIAGVHLLTFARIHYDQLFGLHPTIICALSWVIGAALGLSCITNGDIVEYDPRYHHCIWRISVSGIKFLTYLVLLGVLLPSMLTWYAYVRVLGILYHSPIVFQALGLYKSRFLVYGFLISPLYCVPFFVVRFASDYFSTETHAIAMFMAYFQCVIGPLFYGLSLFLMKEEDMALTARSHKGGGYTAPGIMPQQL